MKTMRMKAFLVAILVFACSTPNTQWRAKAEDPEFLHETIKKITDVIVHDIFSPPVASRIYAYTSVAAYETAIKGDTSYVSLAGQLHGLTPVPEPEKNKEYCFALASMQAAFTVGKALIFSEDMLNESHTEMLEKVKASGIPREVYDRSLEYGTKVGEHILAWSGGDNYKQSRSFPKYTVVDDPSTWKPTPPAYMDGVEPHWNEIRTFVIDSASQFKPAPPNTFSTDKSSEFFAGAHEVYDVGKNLSEEQRQIARFWDCNPFMMNVKGHVMFATKKISPGGHWINITRKVCESKNASVAQSAEAYVRVSIGLADGFISAWDEKYRSRLIRPETYINQYIDENWTPLLQTPPFPEHTSAHSVISSAAAVALTKLFGDNFNFTDSTELEFGMPPRSFNSFLEASSEAGMSRLYGGIHYRRACEIGIQEGRALGKFLVEKIKTRKEDFANSQAMSSN